MKLRFGNHIQGFESGKTYPKVISIKIKMILKIQRISSILNKGLKHKPGMSKTRTQMLKIMKDANSGYFRLKTKREKIILYKNVFQQNG